MSTVADCLKGRRVLVTAGPTWVPIDAVRHLGNRSSGGTGLAIARSLAGAGAEVTLLMGPGTVRPNEKDRATLEIRDFETFDDLHTLVRVHVGSKRFDAVIHAAAVSDYRPVESFQEKLSSEQEELVVRLVRTPKIVNEIKDLDSETFLVKFKLEVGRSREELLSIARASRLQSRADLVVANDLRQMDDRRHQAYLIDENGIVAEAATTEELARTLTEELSRRLSPRPIRSAR